ncbi:MAG: TetR family transcriptional regulator [Actinobacteria bacterium]|nr:TetR family transcriptional regulator [Actinomycetota bacterium]
MTPQSRRSASARKHGRTAATRTGRRAGDSGTREAILEAARTQFAERGYDSATIRAIAAAAGVDPALVHHFYGTKEALFAAAMKMPFVPSEVITAALANCPPGQSAGTHLVRTALSLWDSPGVRTAFVGILRSALTSDQAATMLREFVGRAILGPVATLTGGGDPEQTPFRTSLVASQMLGLAIARYILQLPAVATADADALAAAVGLTIDRYLTGDVRG